MSEYQKEKTLAGCSKSLSSKTAGELKPDFDEPRTKHGTRHVSARQGRAGEKSDFFSVLLGLAFVLPIQSKQLYRLLGSGTSFGCWIEKLSWVGVDADIRHTSTLPDHFIESSRGICLTGI
jgi:hypothetical protein